MATYRRLWLTIVVLASATITACSDGDPAAPAVDAGGADARVVSPEDEQHFQDLVAYAESKLSAKTPGASLAVVVDGKLAFSGGVGIKKMGTEDPVQADTLFRSASMTKMTVAAAILSLVDEGRIALNEPVTAYLSDFALEPPFDPDRIQIEHLLLHTSGLPDLTVLRCPHGEGALAAWVRENPQPLWVEPGVLWNYSNVGYAIAGRVAEAVDGASFEDVVQRRVLDPAGMTTATFDPEAMRAHDYAFGHTRDESGETVPIAPDYYDCAMNRPPGGLFASAADFAHLAEAFLANGGAVLRPDSNASMQSPHVPTGMDPAERYGYGLFVHDDFKGGRLVEHRGAFIGFLSAMWMVPERKFAAVVLVNGESLAPETIAAKAADLFLGLEERQAPNYRTSPETWGVYAGTYQDDLELGTIEVSVEGSALRCEFTDYNLNVLLVQSAGDTFDSTSADFPLSVTFHRQGDGPAQYFVTRAGVGKRVP